MNTETSPSNSHHNKNFLSVAPNWIVAIMAIVGTIGLLCELTQFRKQNETLEKTLKQTYRPVGVVRHNFNDATGKIGVRFYEASDVGHFSFIMYPKIKNFGQGILTYLGSLSYLATEFIPFREKLLNGEIDEVKFDGLLFEARRYPLLPGGDPYEVKVNWENIPYENAYYLYILFLYEDQDGNLFDTEHLELLPITAERIAKGIRPKLDQESPGGILRETYNSYNDSERQKLCQFLRKKNHNLKDIICTSDNATANP